LRWTFVYQRPQHLMSRCAREFRVFFIEEPIYDAVTAPRLSAERDPSGVTVAVPHLRESDRAHEAAALRALVDGLIAAHDIQPSVLWYYTPMSRLYSDHLAADTIVYDCMDELSGFVGAPPGLLAAERELLGRAGVVFTGGRSLFEAKRHLHSNIHPFPSSVDVAHFAQARESQGGDPPDQAPIPRPRLGFFGVLDERFDRDLIRDVAAARPDWHIVLIGPVVKVDPASLPQAANIHYLGQKRYEELPRYLAGWDVALLPFARNDATRYISPTKTPEYLAGGRPVVSTSIADVVHPYGDLKLARIADRPEDFVAAVDAALREDPAARQRAADTHLATMSWDATWRAMAHHIRALGRKEPPACSTISSSEPASLERSWPNVSQPLQARRS
jgi:UDP-galactopyranose mutase